MKIVILSTSDIDGGAARAAYRVHKGIQSVGINSQMLVQSKHSDDPTVIGPQTKLQKGLGIIKPTLDAIPLQLYPKRNNVIFSPAILPNNIATKITNLDPDIINLHWVAGGFLKPKTLKQFNKPIIWTLHDMWAFTGGCHYDQECGRYLKSCGKCPVLGSSKNWDLSRWIWNKKNKAWKDLDFIVVTTSRWLGDCAKASSLFHNKQVKVIPSCLDLSTFKPFDKQISRELLSLPQNKKIILFGAMNSTSDKRKGFQQLQLALQEMINNVPNTEVELLVFGSSGQNDMLNLELKTHYLGTLNDNISLALLYNAADVLIAPSIQENLANIVMESLACGTPCVAFDIGGMSDMIEHKYNGYLAKPFNIEDLAKGIEWVIEDENRWQILSHRARQKAEELFNVESVAQQYIELYNEILGR
jgi:glycosyltransferase involved in cell wall biosynthesis